MAEKQKKAEAKKEDIMTKLLNHKKEILLFVLLGLFCSPSYADVEISMEKALNDTLRSIEDFESQYEKDLNVLKIAIAQDDMGSLRGLIQAGANVNSHDLWNGETVLMYAAKKGRTEAVRELIQAGADVNSSTLENTALMWATERDDTEMIRILIRAGANVDDFHYANKHTALVIAAEKGNTKAVRELIQAGADVNWVVDFTERVKGQAYTYTDTVLTIAVRGNHTEVARELIQAGADVNESATGHWVYGPISFPPLLLAKSRKMVKILKSAGAECNRFLCSPLAWLLVF